MLTYNRAQYLPEAIASVLAQSYKNWQLIIIDDGSTDHTSEVLAQFSDPRITYLKHTENRGLLTRRQESLAQAQGTYIAVLDSDDVWPDPDKLTKQVAYLESNPTTAVIGTYITLIDEGGAAVKSHSYHTTDTAIRQHILSRNQFAHSSVLMRKALVDQTTGYRFTLAEDLDLFLQLGKLGTFANLPEPHTNYRVHGVSETRKKVALFQAILAIIQMHKNDYPGYYKAKFKYTIGLIFALLTSR